MKLDNLNFWHCVSLKENSKNQSHGVNITQTTGWNGISRRLMNIISFRILHTGRCVAIELKLESDYNVTLRLFYRIKFNVKGARDVLLSTSNGLMLLWCRLFWVFWYWCIGVAVTTITDANTFTTVFHLKCQNW